MLIRYASVDVIDVLDVSKRDSIFRYGGKSAYEDAENSDKLGRIVRVSKLNKEFLPVIFMAVHGDEPNTKGDMFEWGSWDDKSSPELLRYAESDIIGVPGTQSFRRGGRVYETFIGKGFYKEHRNFDPSLAVGFLSDAVANDKVKGIEVLAMIDRVKDPALVRSIEAGYPSNCSMGAAITEAICSICGTVAKTPVQFCNHLINHRGQKYAGPETGGVEKTVYATNRGVHFIELSAVNVPADPLATKISVLTAAANDTSVPAITSKAITALASLVDSGKIDEASDLADYLIESLKSSMEDNNGA